MDRIKAYLLLGFMTIVASSCDPEFNYSFNGKLEADGKALANSKLRYHFLPEESAENWRSLILDSVAITNDKGEFFINQTTFALKFDSLRIKISKEGYDKYELISRGKSWRTSIGFNKKDIKKNLGLIKLIEIDSVSSCQLGINKARNELKENKLIHHEFLQLGTRNLEYWEKYEKALNRKGILLKVSVWHFYPYPSNKYYENECYLEETKKILEGKFGVGWLDELKNDIE